MSWSALRKYLPTHGLSRRRTMNRMLDAFRMLGPIESLDWVAIYFDGYQSAMAVHGHPAPWCDELVADVHTLVTKYKARRDSVRKDAS